MRRKQYIFGYGSLVSPEDVFRTLGRRVELIHPVTLQGWVRDWGVVVDITQTHRKFNVSEDCPTHIAALNIRRPEPGEQPTNPNGVLFEVTDIDLTKIDIREHCYERVEVTTDVIGVPEDAIVYAYSGLEAHLLVRCDGLEVVIPKPYQDIVVRGFTALGPAVYEAYMDSTLISDLVVHDLGMVTEPDHADPEHQD